MRKIQLCDVASKYQKLVKPIMVAFGSVLKHLCISSNGDQINLEDLAYCTVLNNLTLDLGTVISSDGNDPSSCWSPEKFLPSLNELTVVGETCLGLWAPLFEAKSKMIRLSLGCCHIGTKVN